MTHDHDHDGRPGDTDGPAAGDHDGSASGDVLDELLGAYALDALDDDERDRVERLLAADPSARAEADRLADAMAEVAAEAVGPVTPPDHLWAAIAAQLPERSDTGAGDPVGADARPEREPAPEMPRTPIPAPLPEDRAGATDELAVRRARRARRSLGAAVAAAAAVVLVLVGITVVRQTDDPSLTDQLAQEAERVAAAPGSRTAELTGADPAVAVRVVIDEQGRGILVADGLPALPDGETYQLWSVDGGTPISLGLLGGAPDVVVVGTGTGPGQLAITAEPAGGSTGPTSDPVAVGTVA